MPLSSDAIRHLRGLGHHLDPIVQVGKEGVTEGLVAAAGQALLDHELVKVRIGSEAPEDRKETAAALAAAAKAELIQVLGRTCLIYKRHPNKPTILLPGEKAKKVTRPGAKGKRPPKRPSKAREAEERPQQGGRRARGA